MAHNAHRNFSPIPKRVMDGSEPGESVPAAVLSGAPTDLQARTVRYVT
jgi:NADH dehydrogenase (ubiquinone) Fe-S protein 4